MCNTPCRHYATEVFAAMIFLKYKPGSCATVGISNRQCLRPAWIMDTVYFNILIYYRDGGNFFQYIDMKKLFQWQPYLVHTKNIILYAGMSADQKEKAWKAWKSVWIWAKSLQNGLKRNKSAGIWTSWKQEFLQKQENLHPCIWTGSYFWQKEELGWKPAICICIFFFFLHKKHL